MQTLGQPSEGIPILASGWYEAPSQYDEIFPFTGTTLSTGANNTLTITKAGSRASRFTNPDKLASYYDLANDEFYLSVDPTASGSALYKATFVSTGTNSITFSLPTDITASSVTTGYGLVMGVNANFIHNRFFIAGQSAMMRFSEFHLNLSESSQTVKIRFECDTLAPTFAASTFLSCTKTYDVVRLLLPREQSRGRWISAQVAHSKPYETFTVCGFSYVAGNIGSFRTKRNNV
jgi:hypothetical protein